MKIYSDKQVSLATFLASPIAGGILMAHNERAIGRREMAWYYICITIAATVVLILLSIFVLPERKPGNYLIPLLLAAAMKYWSGRVQGNILTSGDFPDAKRASWWATIGISLLVVISFAVLIIGYALTT